MKQAKSTKYHIITILMLTIFFLTACGEYDSTLNPTEEELQTAILKTIPVNDKTNRSPIRINFNSIRKLTDGYLFKAKNYDESISTYIVYTSDLSRLTKNALNDYLNEE